MFLFIYLSDLLNENFKFSFGDEQKIAFHELILCTSTNIYSQMRKMWLHINASQTGCVNDGQHILFLQKSLIDNCPYSADYVSKKSIFRKKKFNSYKLNALAIIKALKEFSVYMLSKYFKIITDSYAFKMSKQDMSLRIAR